MEKFRDSRNEEGQRGSIKECSTLEKNGFSVYIPIQKLDKHTKANIS